MHCKKLLPQIKEILLHFERSATRVVYWIVG